MDGFNLNIAVFCEEGKDYIADSLINCNKYNITKIYDQKIDSKIDSKIYNIYLIDDLKDKRQNLIYNLKNICEEYIIVIDYFGDSYFNNDKIILIEKPLKLAYLIKTIDYLASNSKNNHLINKQYNLNKISRILTIKSKSKIKHIQLTEKEMLLLEFLFENDSKVSKQILLEDIWNYYNLDNTHTIENHIYRLRQKLGDNSTMIQTTQEGYRINCK